MDESSVNSVHLVRVCRSGKNIRGAEKVEGGGGEEKKKKNRESDSTGPYGTPPPTPIPPPPRVGSPETANHTMANACIGK